MELITVPSRTFTGERTLGPERLKKLNSRKRHKRNECLATGSVWHSF